LGYITVEELELLSFFEVEPSRGDPNVPWPYNEFVYRTLSGEYSIVFSLWPAHRDFNLSVAHNGTDLYTAKGRDIDDIKYHKDGEVETLEFVVSDRDRVWFRLRPTLFISQDALAERGL
jgi:hypothetical protein